MTEPNSKEFVFVRMIKGFDKVELMDGIEAQLLKDEIYFLPYDSIK